MDRMSASVAAVIAVGFLAVVIGMMRRDSRRTIVLNAIGYPLFLIGLGWASEVGDEAFWAAVAASLGTLLFTMASHRPAALGEARSPHGQT